MPASTALKHEKDKKEEKRPVRRRALPTAPTFALFAVLALAAFLSSCSNNPYPTASAKQILYTALSEDPRTLDPAQVSDVTSGEITNQIYDALYQNSYLDRPYKVEPALAAAYPEKRIFYETVTEKGVPKKVARMEYTFRLRDDIYFQDDPCFPGGKGRRVTANDVIYSIKRLADPQVQSTGYWLVAGKIEGIDDFFRKAAAAGKADYSADIKGLQAPDDRTLKITLTEPYPAFIYVMAMTYTAPVPHEAVEYYNAHGRDRFSRHPVGTGAYRLKSWKRQHRIVLERNPTFRTEYYPAAGAPGDQEKGLLSDAGKRLPLTDEVWYTIVPTAQPVWLLFLQGYLDASGIPQEQFDRVITKQLDLSAGLRQKGHLPGDRERPGRLLCSLQHARPGPREEQVPAAGALIVLRQRPVQPDLPERPRSQRPRPPAPRRLRLRPVAQKPL